MFGHNNNSLCFTRLQFCFVLSVSKTHKKLRAMADGGGSGDRDSWFTDFQRSLLQVFMTYRSVLMLEIMMLLFTLVYHISVVIYTKYVLGSIEWRNL